MAKKNLSGLDALLGDQNIEKQNNTTRTKVEKPKKEPEQRATFLITSSDLENLKAVAYWERKKQKNILHDALTNYFKKYEKSYGKIKPIPNDIYQ